jgi:aryl-alcohol dehydrogenase-like predicted oxidoreductase
MGAVIVVRMLSRARGRFQGGNLQHNLALVDALRTVAQAKGVTVAQTAIAWVAPRPPISCRWPEPAAVIDLPRPSAPRS